MSGVLYVLHEERDRLRAYIDLIDQDPEKKRNVVWAERRAQAVEEMGLMEELLRAAAAYEARPR